MLEYIALGILVFAAVTVFYGIIAIHDIPYEIAKHRKHPQQDAIHIAGWVSLMTLHAIWPFLWIWASLYREDRGWGFSTTGISTEEGANTENSAPGDIHHELTSLKAQLKDLESRIIATETLEPKQGGEK